jgi:hypothetical protein
MTIKSILFKVRGSLRSIRSRVHLSRYLREGSYQRTQTPGRLWWALEESKDGRGIVFPATLGNFKTHPWIPKPASEPKTIFFMYMKEGKRKEAKGRESRRNTPIENVGVPPACKRSLN